MEIQDYSLRKLLNNEYLALCREFEALIEKADPTVLEISDVFDAFKLALQAFDDSIVKVRKSAMTPQMNAADADRDDYHIGIIEQILTAQRHFDPLVKAVGIHMDPLVAAFQGGQTRAYDDQTGMTNNFLQELQSDKYKDDVEKLNLSGSEASGSDSPVMIQTRVPIRNQCSIFRVAIKQATCVDMLDHACISRITYRTRFGGRQFLYLFRPFARTLRTQRGA